MPHTNAFLLTMRTKLLLAFLLCTLFAKAQTIEVSGLQSGCWEADTIMIIDNVIVQDSLNIMPGTTVLFDGFFNISVEKNASLKALGTENDSILFTVADTTGFSIFDSGRGGWNGIRMEKAGQCRFEYCRFQYGKAALDNDQDGGALRIFNSHDVEISHCTLFCNFSREHGGGLNAEDSKVMMHDCSINNNLTYSLIDTIYFMYGGGLRFLKCEVDITKTDFRNNNGESAIGGALSIDSCLARIDRCQFEYNYGINGAGLYMIRCYDNPCSITNSLFSDNTSGHFGGGLAISDSSPLVANLTVVNNHSIGVNCGGIFFYQQSSPVLWNCIVYGNTNEVPLDEPVQMWSWTYEDYAPEFHNCLVQYGFENISNHEIILVYENCIDEDPLFADPDNENFRLSTESPCVDAGAPETPTEILNGLDLDGHQRVSDNCIDLGAYEYDLTDILETSQKGQLLHIVGNPISISSYAEIECESAGFLFVKVYSIEGKQLYNRNLGKTQIGLNRIEIGELFQSLSSGSYLLVVQAAGRTRVAKVVKP